MATTTSPYLYPYQIHTRHHYDVQMDATRYITTTDMLQAYVGKEPAKEEEPNLILLLTEV